MQPQNLLQSKFKFHVENVPDSLAPSVRPFTDDSIHYSVSARVLIPMRLVCGAGQRVLEQTVFIAPRKVKLIGVPILVWIFAAGQKMSTSSG